MLTIRLKSNMTWAVTVSCWTIAGMRQVVRAVLSVSSLMTMSMSKGKDWVTLTDLQGFFKSYLLKIAMRMTSKR